jgi:hypothetical protein
MVQHDASYVFGARMYSVESRPGREYGLPPSLPLNHQAVVVAQ